jgi:hypothetical protein
MPMVPDGQPVARCGAGAAPTGAAPRLALVGGVLRVGLCLVMLAALIACEPQTRVVRDGWGGLRELADPKADPVDPRRARQGTRWAIELERFVGNDRFAKAESLAARVRTEAGLPNVRVQDGGAAAIVIVGPVADPRTEDAQAILQRVRLASLDGMRPYRGAEYRPMAGGLATAMFDPHDLRQFGGMYTLQIGFYDSRFGADFREAAEKAVRELRADGDDAYYYHGPNQSLITVGLFSYGEAFVTRENPLSPGTSIDAYSEAVRKLQRKYPHNLGNGLTLIERVRGETVGEQPSSLVRIPQR